MHFDTLVETISNTQSLGAIRKLALLSLLREVLFHQLQVSSAVFHNVSENLSEVLREKLEVFFDTLGLFLLKCIQ